MKIKSFLVAMVALTALSCENAKKKKETSVLEVTTFSLKSTADGQIFNKLDVQVEADFTSKQPGFIRRESAVNSTGEYTVLVYWNTMADAQASMSKFMKDTSVINYAGMIEGSSMVMNRFNIDASYNAETSNFVEMMTFDTQQGVDLVDLEKVNNAVAKETAARKGFIQRITGVDETGKQVVLVYWDTKVNSDAALQPFMNSPTSKEFMGMMKQSSIVMTRSQKLSGLN